MDSVSMMYITIIDQQEMLASERLNQRFIEILIHIFLFHTPNIHDPR